MLDKMPFCGALNQQPASPSGAKFFGFPARHPLLACPKLELVVLPEEPTRSFALFDERAHLPPVGLSVVSTRPPAPSWLVQLERTIRKLAHNYAFKGSQTGLSRLKPKCIPFRFPHL
jgi:hypothetical protein